ncbi:MAG: glycosyltransferase family 4 protein [Duncaniella sp.]|nr:glycosyltransferase family 4 protein [Duncaniella sp.]
MIGFIINSLDVRGGTHKQLLKLLEYTEAKGEDFFIVTCNVDFERTYPEFRKYASRIRLFKEIKGSRGLVHRYGLWKRNCEQLRSLVADADVVNMHDTGFDTWMPAFRKIPTVWQINDLHYSFRQGNTPGPDNLDKRAKRLIIRLGIKHIDAITVNVSKNADRVRQQLGRKAKVLYCGIEPLGLVCDCGATFSRFADRRINLLSSGVWFPYRNYETQVEVVRLLVDAGWDARLDIIGSTQYSPAYVSEIEKLIRKYNLEDRITIHGMVDEKRFKELHSNADIFMFVNIDQSWGLAVFEAMSCGLPVIVSESVGATEILHDGIDSVWVNPLSATDIADRVTELATDRELYTRLSDAGRSFHNRYSWDESYCAPMYRLLQSLRRMAE